MNYSHQKLKLALIGIDLPYHVGGFFKRALHQANFHFIFIDEWLFFGNQQKSFPQKVFRKIVKKPLAYWQFNQQVVQKIEWYKPDVVLVTKGPYLSVETLARIRCKSKLILINYATDDPFNPAIRTNDLINGIPYYQIYASTKQAIIDDIIQAGGKHVVYLPFGYDPSVHFPPSNFNDHSIPQSGSDLVFIGCADADRMVLFNYLLQVTDINFRLYGSYWSRYSEFKSKYYGYAYGDDYRKVLIESKIALCLLRHANRDGHAMRSYEIPACGVFMLAERSAEHTHMFIEDREAVFFTDINELISKVRYYHSHEIERQKIAYRGYQRITESRNTYLDRLEFLFHLIS